ncbi:MAG: substrate-binding domain-containing protein [Sedimentisphaerales bacterium]|nr:substrate-binding domain-containing protein [Sedimentisphaerales bacterium]
MATLPRVLFLVDNRVALTREILLGIARYTRLQRTWFIERDISHYLRQAQMNLAEIERMRPDGIVCLNLPARQERFINKIIEMGLPLIMKGINEPVEGAINILSDNDLIARMAAEHLLALGLKHYAFCGFSHIPWAIERLRAFSARIAKDGGETHLYHPPKKGRHSSLSYNPEHLIIWLKQLPKPVGIMSCNDDFGLYICECCHLAGIKVPDEAAVIGVDNDECVCNLCHPPLTSIVRDAQKAGYEAAELLDQRMRGQTVECTSVHIRSTHVVNRESTDVLAVPDATVAEAVHFIRNNSSKILDVQDVVKHLAVSRRSLDQKFSAKLGRTVHEEIARVRVKKIADMLRETSLPITKIAYDCGFNGADHLGRYFRRHNGVSPGEFRRQFAK